MKYQKNSLKKTVVLGTMLVSSAFVFQAQAQTWANPACAPTGCNTPTPINVSGSSQGKTGAVAVGRSTVPASTEFTLAGLNFDTTLGSILKLFVSGQSVFSSDNFTQLFVRGTRADRAGGVNISNSADARIRLEIAGPSSQLINLAPGNALISATNNLQFQGNSGAGRLAQIFLQGATGNVGINTNVPTAKFDVNGSVRIRGGAPGLNKILASDANGLASWKTKEELGVVGGTTGGPWTISGINIFNNNTGNVGVGSNNNPTSLLTVQGNSNKLSEIKIIGTNDIINSSVGLNVDSARNAHVILDRGNIGQTSYVRHATGGTTDWYTGINARQNSDYQISNTFNSEVGQLTIKKNTGNVGIGKNNPVTKLDVVGSGYFSGLLGVAGKAIVGGAEIKNSGPELWLNESDQTSAGLGLWRFQGWEGNFHLYRNTSAAKDFSAQSRVISILGLNNYVGIGVAPTAKLDVDGQVKIRGGLPGINKILASDAEGLSTWKTKEELGLGGSSNWNVSGNNIFNKNTGNVGIGTNNPTSALSIERASTGASISVKSSFFNSGITLDKGGARRSSFIAHSSLGSIDWYTGVNGGVDGNNSYKVSTDFSSDPLDSQLTLSKSGTLDISGVLRMRGGSPGLNKILASDSSGYSSWKTPTEIGIGGSNWTLSNNNLINSNTNGNVGIGKTPSDRLDIKGGLRITSNQNDEYLRISRETGFGQIQTYNSEDLFINPIGNNTILNQGTGTVGIGTPNPNLNVKLDVLGNSSFTGNLSVTNNLSVYDGDVLIGEAPVVPTTVPRPKLAVNGNIRLRTGFPAANKILASTDTYGSATWKTASELGIGGSNWNVSGNNISNKNTGNVGIGRLPESNYKLDVLGAARVLGSFSANTIFSNSAETNQIKIAGGDPQLGKVLTATDNRGNATWQSSASGITTVKQEFMNPAININPFDPDFNIQLFRTISGTVACPSGKVAVSGGGELKMNGGGRAISIAGAAFGGQGGGRQGGLAIGVTPLASPFSRPGVSDYNDLNSDLAKRSWFCSSGGDTAGDVVLRCYARCL